MAIWGEERRGVGGEGGGGGELIWVAHQRSRGDNICVFSLPYLYGGRTERLHVQGAATFEGGKGWKMKNERMREDIVVS
eukprot:767996-Hanusia_phi.AAC.10